MTLDDRLNLIAAAINDATDDATNEHTAVIADYLRELATNLDGLATPFRTPVTRPGG